MARRRASRSDNQTSKNWLTTYGDLVTLLLTFFVLLFSFSTVDAQKLQSLVISLTGGRRSVLDGGKSIDNSTTSGDEVNIDDFFELIPGGTKNHNQTNQDGTIGNIDTDEFVQLYRAIEGFLDEKGIPAEVKISDAHTEILLRFKDTVLFDPGAAVIKDDAKLILDGISVVLNEFDDEIGRVRIDGHADIRPVDPRKHPTNWELSAERAVNVVRYLCEQRGFEASKLSAAAYGEFHPIDHRTTREGLARNRRVEIFIVRVAEPAQTIDKGQ